MAHTHAEPEPPGLIEAASRMREDLAILRGAIERQRGEVERRLRSWVRDRPLLALGTTFFVGYGLGGGLLSRFTVPLAGLALRFGASELVAKTFVDLDAPRSADAERPTEATTQAAPGQHRS